MAELEKIVSVQKKIDPTAPHDVVLVLDATTGQNALSQVEVFKERAGVTGLVMTKLDGTARGVHTCRHLCETPVTGARDWRRARE